jgi:hypothetical protein
MLCFAQWEKRGGMTKAIDAIHQTIAWRKEHAAQLEEVVKPGGKTPNEDKVEPSRSMSESETPDLGLQDTKRGQGTATPSLSATQALDPTT